MLHDKPPAGRLIFLCKNIAAVLHGRGSDVQTRVRGVVVIPRQL